MIKELIDRITTGLFPVRIAAWPGVWPGGRIRACIGGLLLLVACSKEPPAPPAVAERTLIVYLGGDNNLSGESFQKLEAITRVVAQDPVFADGAEVIVYHDPAGASGAAPSLWRLRYGTTEPQRIETYPDENSASAQVLARVIKTATAIAPARRYALWLFSHASGWLPEGTLANPMPSSVAGAGSRSVVVDGKREMELADLAAAIPDHQFDMIVFETCFMAGAEVAWALRDKTDCLLASSAEILSPGLTELYGRTIPQLFAPSSRTEPLTALTAVAQTYFDYRDALSGAHRSATVSVIDTRHLEPLASVTREIIASATAPVDITAVQHFDRLSSCRIFFDLEHYLQTIAATPRQRRQLHDAVAQAVPYARATSEFMVGAVNGFAIRHHCGLTLYIPQAKLPALNDAYRATAWWQRTCGNDAP